MKKPVDFQKLHNQLTGQAIESLGRGDSIRDIIAYTMTVTAKWSQDWREFEKDRNDGLS